VILGTLGWLAAGGINQTASYYKEIAELERLAPNEKVDKRLRVGGDVELNSISRDGRDVHFVLVQEKDGVKRRLNVVYNGIDPLPDTFKDNAPCQALVDGKLGSDNVFHATKLQAKCASKYEAKPVAPVSRG
jgi:cytochrome c-type biogenesis protein CcmE